MLSSLFVFLLFQVLISFHSFEHFPSIWRNQSANVPVVGMELQKLSNGNHHHDAAVPVEAGYVSWLAVSSWCIKRVHVVYSCLWRILQSPTRGRKVPATQEWWIQESSVHRREYESEAAAMLVLHLFRGTVWKLLGREVNYLPRTKGQVGSPGWGTFIPVPHKWQPHTSVDVNE